MNRKIFYYSKKFLLFEKIFTIRKVKIFLKYYGVTRAMSRNLHNLWFYNIFPIIGKERLSVFPNIRPIIRILPIIGITNIRFLPIFQNFIFF